MLGETHVERDRVLRNQLLTYFSKKIIFNCFKKFSQSFKNTFKIYSKSLPMVSPDV